MDKADAEKRTAACAANGSPSARTSSRCCVKRSDQQETPLVDTDASNKAADADAALQELGSDQVAFGYVTTTVTVLDADAGKGRRKAALVERVIRAAVRDDPRDGERGGGLAVVDSRPPYANVRQPIVSTLNLAHLMPVSAVWAAGKTPPRRPAADRDPHRRRDAIPAGHLHRRRRPHAGGRADRHGQVGPARYAGDAVPRYRGSRIFAFDMGRSMRATILGLAGGSYDLGMDGDRFQPLARIDREGYPHLGGRWIEGRLRHEGVAVGPDEKVAIWSALTSRWCARGQRTMTGLSVLLQSNALRQALAPYVLGGAHGLLDADHDRLGMADVRCFEMEELMHSKAAVMAVLHYLFARFDERFDGAPTLLILDEAWLFLDDRCLRRAFASGSRRCARRTSASSSPRSRWPTSRIRASRPRSSKAAPTASSCRTRRRPSRRFAAIYEGFGLNSRQIEIVATAQPKRDYYYQSRLGNRLFDLDLGQWRSPSAPPSKDQRDIDAVNSPRHPLVPFAAAWLRHRGLHWAADLLPRSRPPPPGEPIMTRPSGARRRRRSHALHRHCPSRNGSSSILPT